MYSICTYTYCFLCLFFDSEVKFVSATGGINNAHEMDICICLKMPANVISVVGAFNNGIPVVCSRKNGGIFLRIPF